MHKLELKNYFLQKGFLLGPCFSSLLHARASFEDLSGHFLLPFYFSRRNPHSSSRGILETLEPKFFFEA